MRQEPEQVTRRSAPGRGGVAGPDGGDEGRHEVGDEVRGEAAPGQELAESEGVVAALGQQSASGPVEGGHFGQHAQIAPARHVARLGEQARRPQGPGVLQAAPFAPYRHAHLRLLRGDAEFAEEPQQVRVGAAVVDDEPRVDPVQAAVGRGHVVGVRVTAGPVVGLVHHHVVATRKDVCGGETRHAAPHDRRPYALCRTRHDPLLMLRASARLPARRTHG